jgi:hypothetical protein
MLSVCCCCSPAAAAVAAVSVYRRARYDDLRYRAANNIMKVISIHYTIREHNRNTKSQADKALTVNKVSRFKAVTTAKPEVRGEEGMSYTAVV